MLLGKRWCLFVAACLLPLAASEAASKGSTYQRSKNGVRLVGSSGPRGRVAVLTNSTFFMSGNKTKPYVPLCDASFFDYDAKVMCKMLGYKHGRKYYSPKVNYDAKETSRPGGTLMCNRRGSSGARRLLQSLDPTASAAAAASAASGREQQQGARRSLYPLIAPIVSPSRAPYQCSFMLGDCDSTGPLAAVECSNKAFPPAPPPPPSPPTPPPAPPPVSSDIHILGGQSQTMYGPTEGNLCPSADFCAMYGRVELKVTLSGKQVWAPLCSPPEDLLFPVAEIACEQNSDWPSLDRIPQMYIHPEPSETPFNFSTGGAQVSPGGFNPASVAAWVTVKGFANSTSPPRRVQDLDLQISTKPCVDGALYALACPAAFVRRR